MRLPAVLIFLALSSAGSAFAQSPAPVGLATRLVVVYSRLENALADRTKLDQLLAPDFEEMHVARDAAAAEPVVRHIPRDEWIKQGAGAPSMAQMAVHDQGALRIVSYVASANGRQSYVVDVWKGSELQPLLAIRYRTEM